MSSDVAFLMRRIIETFVFFFLNLRYKNIWQIYFLLSWASPLSCGGLRQFLDDALQIGPLWDSFLVLEHQVKIKSASARDQQFFKS